jgi:hypothetical protein
MLAAVAGCVEVVSPERVPVDPESVHGGGRSGLSGAGCQQSGQYRPDLERLARELLAVSATAPDPRPLVTAAQALLELDLLHRNGHTVSPPSSD